jgi:hypothetical protein
MAILTAPQLAALRQRNDMELSKGARSSHGYPKDTIRDLLQTIDELKAQKKKWQRVATHRGELLEKISNMAGLGSLTDAPQDKEDLKSRVIYTPTTFE